MLLLFCSSCKKRDGIIIEDGNFYIDGKYLDDTIYSNGYYSSIVNRARNFFPTYESLNTNILSINFYLKCMDSKDDNTWFSVPDSTMVLELIFSDDCEYENAKTSANNSFIFLDEPVKNVISYSMPLAFFNIGDWKCQVIKENDIIYPCCNIFCFNDKTNTIRYLCYYDKDCDSISKEKFISSIINGTNCNWNLN